MIVNPLDPLDPRRDNPVERRVGGKSRGAPNRTDEVKTSAVRIGRDSAAGMAQDVADLIRQRQEGGYYHRADVVRAVVHRLVDSGDLDRVVLPDY